MEAATGRAPDPANVDQLAINTIRFLSVDAVQKANSGHPGLPMGAAAMAYVLWTRFLRHNPANPHWFNRDRFVLSAGHGSMLLYSLLHLTGYDLPLEQIRQFRQWGSTTPGYPERGITPGVEVTTGPLGQGFGNGVGMAIAEAYLAARYNRPGFELINHFTYALVSDGDLMEGVAAEAASLAGHLKLGKLIYLYDDNRITLAASTQLTFTEDHAKRFAAYGWHTQSVADGNDVELVDRAIRAARQETGRPSLILVRTTLRSSSARRFPASASWSCARSTAASICASTWPASTMSPSLTNTASTRPACLVATSTSVASMRPFPEANPAGSFSTCQLRHNTDPTPASKTRVPAMRYFVRFFIFVSLSPSNL